MALVQIPNDGNPIPIAPARLVGKEFVFRCPRRGCGESDLAERRFAFLEVVKCPDCAQPMRLAEVHQLQRYLKERAERANHIDGEVKRLQSEGATPPAALAIMGIASSGKTVYLSMLYHALRHGTGFMRGLADRGSAHDELIANFQKLENGSWFPATLTNLGFEVRVDVDDRSLSLSVLDFSGERFKELVYDQRTDASHHTEILTQIQDSLGCLILIDPEQLAPFCERFDPAAEFTAIKLIQMLAARRRAEHVVLVFTKQNANRSIVSDEGGPEEFLHKASNLLYQEVRRWKIPVYHISAVSLEVSTDPDGSFDVHPKPDPLRDHSEVMRPLEALVQRIHPTYFAWLEGEEIVDDDSEHEDDEEEGGATMSVGDPPSDPRPPRPPTSGGARRRSRHGRRRR